MQTWHPAARIQYTSNHSGRAHVSKGKTSSEMLPGMQDAQVGADILGLSFMRVMLPTHKLAFCI